jgi:hypothetical protein
VGTVLLIVGLVVVAAVVLFGVALARRGKRQFEARTGGPGLAPNAPREWAGQHTREAKLHRRIAAAARSLDAQPLGDAVTIEQRVTIEQQILQLDQQLVAVAGVPGPGTPAALGEIEALVTSLEEAVSQLATTGVDMDQLQRNQARLDSADRDK